MSCPKSSIALSPDNDVPETAATAELAAVLATLQTAQAELDRLGQALAAARLDEAITAVTTALDGLKPINPM